MSHFSDFFGQMLNLFRLATNSFVTLPSRGWVLSPSPPPPPFESGLALNLLSQQTEPEVHRALPGQAFQSTEASAPSCLEPSPHAGTRPSASHGGPKPGWTDNLRESHVGHLSPIVLRDIPVTPCSRSRPAKGRPLKRTTQSGDRIRCCLKLITFHMVCPAAIDT